MSDRNWSIGDRLKWPPNKTVWEVLEVQERGLVLHTIAFGRSSHKHLQTWDWIDKAEAIHRANPNPPRIHAS